MTAVPLKEAIRSRLWDVSERLEFVESMTLTGSFVEAESLEGVSDIDCVVVMNRLNASRYQTLISECETALRQLLRDWGYDFHINPTLGPLKFNAPKLAVLHLMMYSQEARIRHARQSPFTCLDWQRSKSFHKKKLADVYPVLGLMPRHFLSSRRSVADYLRDLQQGVVSYRELICTDSDYTEYKRVKPMSVRDRHEFAYHVMRFLMMNLRKLIRRTNETCDNEQLLNDYFMWFPEGAGEVAAFYRSLAEKKKAIDYAEPLPNLQERLQQFAHSFESQFRRVFQETATRHLVLRHAPTAWNGGNGESRIFQGHTDVPILPMRTEDLVRLTSQVRECQPMTAYCSPLQRTGLTLEAIGIRPKIDQRLIEQDYGRCEGKTIREVRARWPELFTAWTRGEDPAFPEGESLGEVASRVERFANEVLAKSRTRSIICTHNVVLKCLIGQSLGMPRAEWHRLTIPHLAPIELIQTAQLGRFVDISEENEPMIFNNWEPKLLTEAA
jgi:ribonuclease H / adenosylcobalamin/alpha-ribazole phosphatase